MERHLGPDQLVELLGVVLDEGALGGDVEDAAAPEVSQFVHGYGAALGLPLDGGRLVALLVSHFESPFVSSFRSKQRSDILSALLLHFSAIFEVHLRLINRARRAREGGPTLLLLPGGRRESGLEKRKA